MCIVYIVASSLLLYGFKVYKVLYRDPVCACRVHVHNMFTTQFLRARANIYTVIEGQKHVYCMHPWKQWARK